MKQENTQGSTLSVSPATATAEIVRGPVDSYCCANTPPYSATCVNHEYWIGSLEEKHENIGTF